MRRGAARTALAALLLAAAARAQPTPDVAPGAGVLRGRVAHATRPDAAAGVPVVLYALSAVGEPGLRETTTGADGRFHFEGIASDPQTVYLVGTRVAGIPFGQRVAFAPGAAELEVELAVADPTDDVAAASLVELRLRVDRGCAAPRVIESLALHNGSERVIHVPEDGREGRAPIFRWRLPEGASDLQALLGDFEQGLEMADGEVRYWGPLHPGSRELEFHYALPAGAGELALRRRFERGIGAIRVLSREADPSAPAAGFEPAGRLEIEGASYRSAVLRDVAAGRTVELRVPLPAPAQGDPRLATPHVSVWLELDDAALRVDESHALEVTQPGGLAGAGRPLLCIELPPGASALRFGSEALALGLAPDPSGALAVRGPLPPGRTQVSLRYRLPVEREPVVFERRFERPVELLSIFVADTGVVPQTERLHRLRPSRSPSERSYIRLEGFAIAPGERVALRLARLARGGGPPSAAIAAFVVAAALAALAFLAAPLLPGRQEAPAETEPEAAAREREALYASIHDLDHDFETGKVSAADHARMRDELRARALQWLRAEREAKAAPAPAAPAGGCPSCGAAPAAGDRFCSQCGARLADGGGSGAG